MVAEVVGVLLFLMSAGTGAIAGSLAARKKMRAIEAVAASAGPFPGPARPAPPEPRGKSRVRGRGRLWKHDYDLMIGRTFFR